MRHRVIYGILLTVVMMIAAAVAATAQERKITPVDIDESKPSQPTLHYYDKHGNPLKEPVLFLADLDTVTKVNSGPVYPLLNSVSVGLNFLDLPLMAVGQKHASLDVWADLSLHNWFFPIVEVGIGFANNTPSDGNYTYRCKPSLYIKAGINYNFLYKSNPDYQAFFGLRGGYANMRYDIDNVSISSDYWGQTNNFSIKNQTANAFFGEVLVGVKVKIYDRISMGWTGRYHFKFHSSAADNSNPWFIPGYGTNNASITATFSIIYTLPLAKAPQTTPLTINNN